MRYKGVKLFVLFFGFLFIFGSTALATSIDQMWLSLKGYAGETIKNEIKLEGTEPGDRTGFWYTRYKEMEGDSDRMDISSWITIEPKDFTIKQKEVKKFTVTVKVPKDAKPGLYGATIEDSGREGRSGERRTYLVFKDAEGEGNVYSGLLIPTSVTVLAKPGFLGPAVDFIKQNMIIIVLSLVIVVLLVLVLLKKKSKLSG